MAVHHAFAAATFATGLMAIASNPAGAAALTVKDLQGAWLGQETGCTSVFAFAGDVPSFKRPADAFLPAFIVTGNRLTTPLASCRIEKTSEVEKGTRVSMKFANSVSTATVITTFAFGRGALLRLNENGMETGYFNRCAKP